MDFLMNNGMKIPAIGVGTYLMRDEKDLSNVINTALDLGYKLIDTASIYRNEDIIGDIVAKYLSSGKLKREDIFITTKLAATDHGRGTCKKSVLESIKRLKLAYVDMVLIHWPGTSKEPPKSEKCAEKRKGSWEDLEELQQEGMIRSIGVSNYTVRHLEQLLGHAKIKPVVNQIEIHPLYYPKDVIEFCKNNSIVVQAYSSLGAEKGWQILSQNAILKEIADKNGKSIAQILLRWALQHDFCIIPKTKSVERVKENFEVLNFNLPQEDMERINGMNENQKFCWDPEPIL